MLRFSRFFRSFILHECFFLDQLSFAKSFVCLSNTRTDTISNTNFRIKILTFLRFGVFFFCV